MINLDLVVALTTRKDDTLRIPNRFWWGAVKVVRLRALIVAAGD